MRSSFVLGVSVVLTIIIGYSSCEIEPEGNSISAVMEAEKWEAYKATHNKAYGKEEDAERFEIYKANLAMIEEHNKKYDNGETSYKMGENHMTDWKPEEKSRMLGLRPPSDQQ